MDKFGVNSSEANILNSLVYIISAVASPFLGLLVDKTGFNLFWCKLSFHCIAVMLARNTHSLLMCY